MKLRARGRTEYVAVRLEAEQARLLRESAEKNERSVSAELRLALRKHLKEVAGT